MESLLKTASVRVSSIQIMQVRVQNKGESVWKSRYVGDLSVSRGDEGFIVPEEPLEQERFKSQLIVTARSLKKKQ